MSEVKKMETGIPIVCAVHNVEIGRTEEGFVLGDHQFIGEGKIIDTSGCFLCMKSDCDRCE
jgi:hypothetical protein